jgi:hypothetical protein
LGRDAIVVLALALACTPLPHVKEDGSGSRVRHDLPSAEPRAHSDDIPNAITTTPPPAPPASAPRPGPASAPGGTRLPASNLAAAGPADAFDGTTFPPPNLKPPEPGTAEAGDGVWQAMPDGTRDGRPTMVRTRIHPHAIRRDKYIDIIAIDRQAADLVLMVGTDDPASDTIPMSRRSGLIPPSDYDALVAVFNGGFLQKHGKWGLMKEGDLFTPPRADGCTIGQYRTGRLRIASFAQFAGADLAWYRQTPPCLVEGGVVNPGLSREPSTVLWGAAIGGARDIRRSALGIDASGRTMFYVFSDWNTANELARALLTVGIPDVAELDVNWSYTKFFLFENEPGEPPQIKENIVPKLPFDKRRYVRRAAERDFFYVRLRSR